MSKIGIVGATGYTGSELLRLLAKHPDISIHVVTSRSEQGQSVAGMFPNLRGLVDLEFSDPKSAALRDCKVVFYATPNGTAMAEVGELLDAGIKVIDLSADFRLKDSQVWSQWYGQSHAAPELLEQAVYGLPELNREAIKKAQLVANPGCYPTAVVLSLLPVVEQGISGSNRIIVDAKSGVSGAGRKAAINTLFSETGESFKAYGASGHRHYPEICQSLEAAGQSSVSLTFVPHLVPMVRGIHSTAYVILEQDVDVQSVYEKRFKTEPFIDIMPPGSHPETRSVRGSNVCRMSLHQPQRDMLVVLSVIDNLVKGAAGQAIQNMNLMCGYDETSGLDLSALLP